MSQKANKDIEDTGHAKRLDHYANIFHLGHGRCNKYCQNPGQSRPSQNINNIIWQETHRLSELLFEKVDFGQFSNIININV